MDIVAVAGMAPISRDPEASRALYRDTLGLPFKEKNGYLSFDRFPGINHFGIWPLREAALACVGQEEWPAHLPVPNATVEFELKSPQAVDDAVEEMKARGYTFVHEARQEPWGQITARFLSPEALLIGLSYAPWLHEGRDGD